MAMATAMAAAVAAVAAKATAEGHGCDKVNGIVDDGRSGRYGARVGGTKTP